MSSVAEQGAAATFDDQLVVNVRPRKELFALTSIRGFAALSVVLLHMDAYCGDPLLQFFPVDTVGMLAVDLFFVLSGFILTHVYATSWADGEYSHRDFLIRRFARIWPLHFACLMAVAAIVLAGTYVGLQPTWHVDISSFLSHLFLLNATGLSPELSWNQPDWSVGAEWTAYLLFPLYLVMCSAIRPTWAKLAASVLFMLALYTIIRLSTGLDLLALDANGGALRIVPSFFAGVALRQVYETGFGSRLSPRKLNALLVATVGIGFLLLEFRAPALAVWPLLPALIYLLALRALRPETGFLRTRFLIWLGEVSYALYLVHAAVLMLVFGVAGKVFGINDTATLLVIGIISIMFSIILAAIAHYVIEQPAQAYIVGLAKRKRRSPQPA